MEFDKEQAKNKIKLLVESFQKEVDSKKINSYQEMEIRANFIDKLFEALGWDVYNRDEVVREIGTHEGKRADYIFKLNNKSVFVVEAKKADVNLTATSDDGIKVARQTISYGYHKKIKISVATNFKNLVVYHSLNSPKNTIGNRLYVKEFGYFDLKSTEFIEKFDILWLLSKESFLKNELEKSIPEKVVKTSKPIDEAVIEDLLEIRKILSSDIKNHNQELLSKYNNETNVIDEAVQRLINRLIFIRYTEDMGLEEDELLLKKFKGFKDMTSDKRLYSEIREVFKNFNDKYNSKLFSLHEIDNEIKISEAAFSKAIKILYFGLNDTNERYNFSHIEVDLLGSIYEQYLGILLSSGEKRTRLKESKSKRKGMGIYYTPEYIVDYIVKNTVSEAIKNKTIDQILETKILDPACGSGSFLQRAFDEVCRTIEDKMRSGEKAEKFKSFQKLVNDRLGLGEKITILKNTIYGVDLDEKAVEIAQLSLLLKLLENEESKANKMLLPTMTDNIQHGNSLIDDPAIAGDTAFKWEARFRNVFANGKFDVVIGNPPYGAELKENERDLLESKFCLGNTDTAALFMAHSLYLVKAGGLNGFIVPKPFVYSSNWKTIREK